jgi:chromate transporter
MSEMAIASGSGERSLPSFAAALTVWARIGILSFGGPAAQIALMHREIVDARAWLSERQFLNALSFCMLLPGPEAMQLATYVGWRLHGTLGGLAAGLLFVLPGAAVVLALAALYAALGDVSIAHALFLGVKAAVVVIVVEALLRVSRRALRGPEHWAIAALAFVAIFFFAAPFPLIVAAAALFGLVRGDGDADIEPAATARGRSLPATLAVAGLWLALWLVPLLGLGWLASGTILPDIAAFFSKLAVVTFGGAYAVLAYMAQDVVIRHEWLTAGEMMDGLGLAETTPGPLILVTEFVGFLAAYREGGIWLGLAGALVTLWATFVPCFLWIFVGAPYVEWIATQPRLRGALAAITAAVVGVILNLSIWFALHVFFREVRELQVGPLHLWMPEVASLDWRVVVLALGCAALTFGAHWGIARVLAVAAVTGAVLAGATG